MRDLQRLKELYEVFDAMQVSNKSFMDSAKEAASFYTGGFGEGQWAQEDLQKLRRENRPPLQLNIILPKVNLVTGIERQNRSSWKALPVEPQDEDEASLITALLFHLDMNRKLQNLFSRVHKDGTITGRGWIDVFVEPGRDFLGEIKVRREGWQNVLMDPEADTPDTGEWMRLGRTKWLSLGRLKSLYPDQFADLKKIEDVALTDLDLAAASDVDVHKEMGDFYRSGEVVGASRFVDPTARKARVVELWEREWTREHFIVNSRTGKLSPQGFERKKDAEEVARSLTSSQAEFRASSPMAQIPEEDVFDVIVRSVPKTFMTVFSGARMILDKVPNPYSHNEFPLVPYFYYFEDVGGAVETFGLVENMKDPQREKDKRRSQALDIMNRTPKGGGVFAGGKVTSDQMNDASSSGKWVSVPGFRGNVREFMQQWSTSHLALINTVVGLEQAAAMDAKEISGATDPLMGIAAGSKESGFAAQTRIRQGMLTLQEQMENLDRTKSKVLSLCISNMQQFYTRPQIMRIVGNQMGGELPSNEVVQKFLNNFESMRFDVVLDGGKNSPTMKAMKADQVGELIKMGFQSLFPLWLELSDLEAKDEIIAKMEEERAAQMIMQQVQQGIKQGGAEG
jgi:hypothetical protein